MCGRMGAVGTTVVWYSSVELLSVSIMSRPFLRDRGERPVAADEKETIPILIPFPDELRASRLVGPVAVRYLIVRQQLWV